MASTATEMDRVLAILRDLASNTGNPDWPVVDETGPLTPELISVLTGISGNAIRSFCDTEGSGRRLLARNITERKGRATWVIDSLEHVADWLLRQPHLLKRVQNRLAERGNGTTMPNSGLAA